MGERRGYYVNSGLREEARRMREKLNEKAKLKEKENELLEIKRKQEEELAKLRKEQQRKREIELKTKNYFEFNKYNRKVPVEGKPFYYGDFVKDHKGWYPEGDGQFHCDENIILDGIYQKGIFKKGKILFLNDGTRWNGHIKDDMIHGAGRIIDPDGNEIKAIAFQGSILCRDVDLETGRQIEFSQSIFENYGWEGNKPRATILKHIQDWCFIIRFHDEVWPRDRQIDFSTIGKFRVLRDHCYVYDLQTVGVTVEAPKVFDYRRKLGSVVERPLEPQFPSRAYEERRLNYFESREVGIGAAKEEDELAERQKMKKLQWAKLVEEKKAKFMADRQKQIEEEQAKIMEQSLASTKANKEKEKQEAEEEAKRAMEAEAKRFDEEYGK